MVSEFAPNIDRVLWLLRTKDAVGPLRVDIEKACAELDAIKSRATTIDDAAATAHALEDSHAECERLRKAAANVAAMYQTDPLATVDGLTDTDFIMRISALRAALAALAPAPPPWNPSGHAVACTRERCVQPCPRLRSPRA